MYNTVKHFMTKRGINDTHGEKLQEQFDTRICTNRILAASDYFLLPIKVS